MRKTLFAVWAGLLGTSMLTSVVTPATAQESRRGQTVTERARPDYDAKGLRAGSFQLFPQLALSSEYDDNIYASQTGKVDDFIFIARPELRVRSDWGRHAVGLRAGAEVGRHADNSSENYTDYFALADSRFDIAAGTALNVNTGYQNRHEERGAANDVGGAEPTEYDLTTAGVTLRREVARLSGRLMADWRNYDFEDVAAFGGGLLDQDTRDRNEYGVTGRLAYATSPNLSAFVQGGFNWRRYDQGSARDSDGYAVTGGVAVDISGITTGEVFAGYRRQNYKDSAYASVDGLTYGASLDWNPTPLTTVSVGVSNTVEETTLSGSSSFVQTEYQVRVDHELLRNLILGGYAGYAEDDYKGSVREEELYSAGIGVKYLFNQFFNIDVGYGFSSRVSNIPGRDFESNAAFLRLTATY